MTRVRTITFSVNKKTGDVFDAILNIPPKMMPDAKKNNDGWWSFTTPWGPGKLKFNENKQFGILDHQFVEDEAKWNVPMRVVSHGEESEVMITLIKPDTISDQLFDERMNEMEKMMLDMKKILEQN
ncbi:MAG: hypothetical protein NPMRD1_60034 [Nitrosopumilales archaeon]|jgi:hypothetical protein|nr:MAG: hypothetical protein NPMRD1_60034 [Nitrosopumilales archaeon]